jgi:hypothetical protein
MKEFSSYQLLSSETPTERDLKQVNSKFWGKGKWENFVLPHLPKDCKGLSLVDMGCNAGLFLKFAKDKGFGRVIGVDSNNESVTRGNKWANENRYDYKIINSLMHTADLPIVDYTVFANSHYYFQIDDWVHYLDKLRNKTRFVIIVTAEKHRINSCWAQADLERIRGYFKDWKEVSFVDELPMEGDPDPRRLWSLCFESPNIVKLNYDEIEVHNHVQDGFWTELDKGTDYKKTKYYKILVPYRAKWGKRLLNKWVEKKIEVYKNLKENGQFQAIYVNKNKSILDGNHRARMIYELGWELFGRII